MPTKHEMHLQDPIGLVPPSSNNCLCEISLEEQMSHDSEISCGFQQSLSDAPNAFDTSMGTLEVMAGLSNHDRFIYPN